MGFIWEAPRKACIMQQLCFAAWAEVNRRDKISLESAMNVGGKTLEFVLQRQKARSLKFFYSLNAQHIRTWHESCAMIFNISEGQGLGTVNSHEIRNMRFVKNCLNNQCWSIILHRAYFIVPYYAPCCTEALQYYIFYRPLQPCTICAKRTTHQQVSNKTGIHRH